MFFDWKIQLEKVYLTRGLKHDTKELIKEYAHLAKMTKVIAILLQKHEQPSFDSPKTHVPHSSCKNLRKND